MLRTLYSILFYLLLPFAIARLLWRSRAEPAYRETMTERFGFSPILSNRRPVWVHAVSAGETNAAAPLVERLLADDCTVIMTTMTPTGRSRVRALFGERVAHAYAPYDFPGAVRRFFERVDPRLLVIVDTELWPNILAEAKRRGIDSVLVNARLSERSARRYRWIAPLTREMLESLSHIACQTAAQGERFVSLGLDPSKLLVAGSIKFDIDLPSRSKADDSALREKLGQRRVILGASTHAGEETAMLDVIDAIEDPSALLVLAPRHPNRCDEVASLCRSRGFDVVRHSTGEACDSRTRVYLLDTMGELMDFYSIAEIAFVGGSLVPVGGHNPMEPAAVRVPIVMGPHLFNIDEIADRFLEAGAMTRAGSQAELVDTIKSLYENSMTRRTMADNAMRVMAENRGALDRVVGLLNEKRDWKSSP